MTKQKVRGVVYNDIATEEALAKINPDNLKLLEEWEKYLRAISRSQGTIYNYHGDITIFFVFLSQQANNKFFGDIVPRDIMLFQFWCMEDLKLSNNRVRRLKDALSSFSNYVEKFYKDDERLKDFKNIVREISNPARRPSREITELTDSDIKLIFEKLVEDEKYSMAALLALSLYGGLRKAELVQVKTETFDKENIVLNKLYKTPNKIKLKGGEQKHCYFLKQEVDRFIYLWKKQRRRLFREYGAPTKEVEKDLFIHRVDGRWKQLSIGAMTYTAEVITKILKENGINKVFYWETARDWHFKFIKTLPAEQRKLFEENK